MGIQINGITDTISATDGGLAVSGQQLTGVTDISASGIITATQGYVVGTGASIFSPAANTLALGTNGSERVRVDSSGRLAIGSNTPDSTGVDTGVAQLYVVPPNISFGPSATFITDSLGRGVRLADQSKTYSFGIDVNSSSAFVYANSNTPLALGVNASEKARIDTSGRLLVGTSSSPTGGDAQYSKLVVKGYVGDNTGYAPIALMAGTNGASLASGAGIGRIEFCAADSASFAQITASVDGTTGSNDFPGRLTFSVTADGASSPTERMRIQQNGFIKAANNGNYVNTTDAVHRLESDNATNPYLVLRAQNANYAGEGLQIRVNRSANSVYWFFAGQSSDGGDNEFVLKGDGNAFADGSWSGGGADYAEYFEWSDVNSNKEDRRGISVVLDGDKIREAVAGEDPIGVISGNPSVVGDAAWNKWNGKHLRDEFGSYLLDENGERQLNPSYDPDVEYISREERPEWDCVGLMGKLRIRKGQVTGSRWIKMRDISDSVEEWLVR